MAFRYGTGTFILRKEAEKDFYGVAEKLAALGYEGLELLGLFGKKPEKIRKRLKKTGIQALGDHVPIKDFLAGPDRVIDDRLEAGCEYLTIAHREGQFSPGGPGWDAMLDDMRLLIGKCREAGLVPQYHNHGWDVAPAPEVAGLEAVEPGTPAPKGKPYTDTLLDALCPAGLCFEPDLGWMTYSSASPADYLRRYRAVCRVIHLKDVYADDFSQITRAPGSARSDGTNGGFEFRPTGYGTVNFPALMPLIKACESAWLVIDHDLAYERDPYGDLKISLDYIQNLIWVS